jgi:hypothetical protein
VLIDCRVCGDLDFHTGARLVIAAGILTVATVAFFLAEVVDLENFHLILQRLLSPAHHRIFVSTQRTRLDIRTRTNTRSFYCKSPHIPVSSRILGTGDVDHG